MMTGRVPSPGQPDGHLVGLCRVSTGEQDLQLQRDALTAAGCARIFEEKVSTRRGRDDRPGLTAALDYLRPHAGDVLVVWRLDRLGRSTKDILTIADELHERGIGLRVLTGTLAGTYTPTGEGKFFFTVMAAFAELERDVIHERTMAGLDAARRQGRVGGRPSVMDDDTLAAARARQARGERPTQIAKALGVSRATIYRHLPRQEPSPTPAPTAPSPDVDETVVPAATPSAQAITRPGVPGSPGERMPMPHEVVVAHPDGVTSEPPFRERAVDLSEGLDEPAGTWQLVETQEGSWQVRRHGARVGVVRREATLRGRRGWSARTDTGATLPAHGALAAAADSTLWRTRDQAAAAIARHVEQTSRRPRRR